MRKVYLTSIQLFGYAKDLSFLNTFTKNTHGAKPVSKRYPVSKLFLSLPFLFMVAFGGQCLAQTITGFDPSAACAGTASTITITGTHFKGITAVKFNGVNATSFTVVNSTTITAELPTAGVTSGHITIISAEATIKSESSFIINAKPAVTIKSDYCAVPENVHLTATCVPAAAGYLWSTGDTTQSIDVDIASDYSVTAFVASGCSAKATVGVAKEFVVNGDFTDGNTGFMSDYTYYADVPGNSELVNDAGTNGYGVGTDGQNYHNYFFGKDHTRNSTGNRNFLLVNGHGNTLIVWKTSVNVLPNTTYYFSAWGMSLNDVAPFAKLQFNVNGSQVGTIGSLNAGAGNVSNNGWVRFYGTWTSGAATTSAVISVTDLETALNGNDFGLDDVSFGTLSTFIKLESAPGTDSQTICGTSPIINIQYSVGSTVSNPLVTGLPPGITATFNGVLETFSGTPTASGIFDYTITTTGTCNPSFATGTIAVQPVAAGGTLTSASMCFGSSDSLILSGEAGSIQSWQMSTNGGTSWTTIDNTTNAQQYANIIVPTKYRVIVNGGCSLVFSSVATIATHNFWVGGTSSDWNTAANWSDGVLPDTFCATVTIPQVTLPNFYPVLSSGITTIHNLQIYESASLVVIGATLQIAGSIFNKGIFDVSNGALNFNGTLAQVIPANAFAGNTIKDIIISNDVSLNGVDSLTGVLSFGAFGKTFATNGNLVLKSTALATAAVGQVINGNNITGDVTVERYISAKRAWRFLSVPTKTTQTIKEAWQEGATSSGSNPVKRYGTQVTNNVTPTLLNGFDYYSADGPSVKKYDITAKGTYAPYKGINTAFDSMATRQGIMIFVRGDRTAAGLGATPTSTTLRTKGPLYIGTLAPVTVNENQFVSVGNPYASPLDMRSIIKSPGINDNFYVWDATLAGTGFGAFQTFTLIGSNYIPTPGGGSYPAQNSKSRVASYNYIQSGQAFFADASNNKGGTLTFTETSKATESKVRATVALRSASSTVTDALLRTNLYAVETNGSATLADGILNDFGDYNNAIDNLDALKVTNLAENLGIKTENKVLVVERRQTVTKEDTIHLNLLKMKVKSYRFEILGSDFNQPGLIATLEDSYTNTRTPINLEDSTIYNFTVINVPGSWNPSRFTIVFKQAVVLPVTFSSVKAYQVNKDIAVEWKVENQVNIKQYEVERSADGQHFSKLATVKATGSNNSTVKYLWLDKGAVSGNNYYRIISIGTNGERAYSPIVKVVIASANQQITVFPNPVVDGKINLRLLNQPKGSYEVRLRNKSGQLMMVKQFEREEGSSTEVLQNNMLAAGIYQLEIIKPDSTQASITIDIK